MYRCKRTVDVISYTLQPKKKYNEMKHPKNDVFSFVICKKNTKAQ